MCLPNHFRTITSASNASRIPVKIFVSAPVHTPEATHPERPAPTEV